MTLEHVTFEELYEAYIDCRRHKRKTESCSQFEMALYANLAVLHRELNEKTYRIGPSICFVVTRPKLREVYAADFRDRIVHHLVIRRFNHLFENHFIPSTYNCRKGRGVLYGVYDMADKLDRLTEHYTQEAWVWKADLKNFFMSIERERLYAMLRTFLRKKYTGEDLDYWLWLIRMIVLHKPEENRAIRGNPKLLDALPKGKKLGDNPGNGVAIGNLPSQIFANFYLSPLDYLLYYWWENEYGRYVDDFGDGNKDKQFLLDMMPRVRRFLSVWFNLQLHPLKWYLQQAWKGVKFTGYVIKQGRIYAGNRLVNNAFEVARRGDCGNLHRFVSRMNSYIGFLIHCNSYAIRRNLWRAIPLETQKKIYITNNFSKIVIRKRYEDNDSCPQTGLETNREDAGWQILFACVDKRDGHGNPGNGRGG